jgi:hypothetical protein
MLILKDSDLIWPRRRRNGDRPYLGRGPPLLPQPLDIARRITEDYNIEHLTLTARFIKRIRLEQGWLRRHNDPAAAEMQEAGTIDAIEQLLAEGHIRQYGRRQLITHLARKHGHRPRRNDVLTALRILDDYGVISRTPGMVKKRRDNYVVPGPDWL